MERDELAAWLRLTLTPGVGNATARRLLAAFGLPQAIFAQTPTALQHVVTGAQAKALKQEPDGLSALLDKTWQWLHTSPSESPHVIGRRLLTLGDTDYPSSLLSIEDPPLLLYALGQTRLLACQAGHDWPHRALAIVGSRNPTPQGQQNARQFAKAFSAGGVTVVSGMALGVDGAAHEGALAACNENAPAQRLATLAVVGTGLDRVYPRQHRDLAHRIARHGLIVSEYPLGTPPLSANFPKRNRLIAGLAQGTLVVEAALQSGSLITARLAGEQGKDVFAIPGSIHSPQSRGAHALIREGAKLVETAQDVLEELRWPAAVEVATAEMQAAIHRPSTLAQAIPSPDSSGHAVGPKNPSTARPRKEHTALDDKSICEEQTQDAVLRALGADPVSLDALLARTGMDTATLQARLLELELEGQVGRLPGGLFQRLALG